MKGNDYILKYIEYLNSVYTQNYYARTTYGWFMCTAETNITF